MRPFRHMPLTANDGTEELNDVKNRKDDAKDQGKTSRHEEIPFPPLPSRQWKLDKWLDVSVQKTNFWFDRMPLTPHERLLLA
ncbi:MAG: hypothetical protein LAO30_19590 [Acidobacteriia bacterium]|nr:hypothetical protein [Terriglobia bacterium]